MVVHMLLLAAGGIVHALKFSMILLWSSNFDLVLPPLHHLPRVCVAFRGAAAYYDAELRAYLEGRRRRAPPQQLEEEIDFLLLTTLVAVEEISD